MSDPMKKQDLRKILPAGNPRTKRLQCSMPFPLASDCIWPRSNPAAAYPDDDIFRSPLDAGLLQHVGLHAKRLRRVLRSASANKKKPVVCDRILQEAAGMTNSVTNYLTSGVETRQWGIR